MKLYLCAVKQYVLAHGFRDRLPNMHQLYLTLHGVKRKPDATGHRKPHMPMTIVLLKPIKSYITSTCPNLVDQRMLWAASALAFFCFLRSSEYTSLPNPNTIGTLQSKDITMQKSRIRVRINASKADPFREGKTVHCKYQNIYWRSRNALK